MDQLWNRIRHLSVLGCIVSTLLILFAACLPGSTQTPTRTPVRSPTRSASPSPVSTTVAAATATWTPISRPTPTSVAPETVSAPWPTDEWPVSTPEEQGIDSRLLHDMYAQLRERAPGIGSVVIVRRGYLVAEGYVHPFARDDAQHLFSVTKSVVSALLGIAMEEGAIATLDQQVLDVFSDYRVEYLDEWKQELTLYHLLTMTSGLEWRENDHLTEMIRSPDWVQAVLDLPMAHQPGAVFNYSSGASHLLSAAIQRGTGQETAAYAQQKLFGPLGISHVSWQADPQGISIGGWGLALTAQDMARFGYLYLRGGVWEGRQIVPAEWVRVSTTSHVAVPGTEPGLGYGYQWWVIGDLPYPAFEASGRLGQRITVIPDLELVVVVISPTESHGAPARLLRESILPAVRSSEPLPPNPEAYAALQSVLEQIARP